MKAVVLASTAGMPREEWLELRRKGIGGSDIGAICGVNPHHDAWEVWLDKIDMAGSGEETESMEWGKRHEPTIAQKFAESHPEWHVQKVEAILQHPEHEWALANPDRLLVGKNNKEAILEIKSVSAFRNSEFTENSIPEYITLQVMWYLGITGCRRGYIAVLVGGNRYKEYEVEFDAQLFERMLEIAKDFWRRVQENDPPQVGASPATSDLLERQYPQTSEDRIELPPQALELAKQFEDAKDGIKRFEGVRDEAANKLKAMLRENAGGVIDNYIVTWKEQTRKSASTVELRKRYPQIYDALETATTTRVFSVKKVGDE